MARAPFAPIMPPPADDRNPAAKIMSLRLATLTAEPVSCPAVPQIPTDGGAYALRHRIYNVSTASDIRVVWRKPFRAFAAEAPLSPTPAAQLCRSLCIDAEHGLLAVRPGCGRGGAPIGLLFTNPLFTPSPTFSPHTPTHKWTLQPVSSRWYGGCEMDVNGSSAYFAHPSPARRPVRDSERPVCGRPPGGTRRRACALRRRSGRRSRCRRPSLRRGRTS